MTKRFSCLTLANVRWTVRPDWQPLLLGPLGLRWADWQAQRRVQLVKQAQHRTVYRIQLDHQAVFVKRYPAKGWAARWRGWFATKARREWQRTLAADRRALPTVELLALGEAAGCESFLVTREWSGGRTLDTYLLQRAVALSTAAGAAARHKLTRALAAFLARLHEAGLRHQDLYPGNVMVRENPAGGHWEFALIDLYAAALGSPLKWRATVRALSLFGNWLWPQTSPSDRLRFWRAYRAERPSLLRRLANDDSAATRKVEDAVWRRHAYVLRSRSRRCLRTNRDFRAFDFGNLRGHAARSLAGETIDEWMKDPDAPLSAPSGATLKASRSSQVVRLPLQQAQCVYKRFTVTKTLEPLTQFWKGSPALRSWIAAFYLREAGIPTPRPLALFERRALGRVHESYLATEHLDDAVTLGEYVAALRRSAEADRTSQLRQLLQTCARMLRRLHRHQLSHRDLKAANWLVAGEASSASPPQVYLIDLVSVRQHWRLGRRRRVCDLARLAVSFVNEPALTNTNRLRFLRCYLGADARERGAWKAWWRGIDLAAKRKMRQNLKRNRPLS